MSICAACAAVNSVAAPCIRSRICGCAVRPNCWLQPNTRSRRLRTKLAIRTRSCSRTPSRSGSVGGLRCTGGKSRPAFAVNQNRATPHRQMVRLPLSAGVSREGNEDKVPAVSPGRRGSNPPQTMDGPRFHFRRLPETTGRATQSRSELRRSRRPSSCAGVLRQATLKCRNQCCPLRPGLSGCGKSKTKRTLNGREAELFQRLSMTLDENE
jgi:hypothetical protein